MKKSAIVMLIVNVLLIIVSVLLMTLLFTDLDVRGRFTQLDRAGVINEQALEQFHPSYGFKKGHIRNTVPRYIAGPALDAAHNNAFFAAFVALVNAIFCGFLLVVNRKGKSSNNASQGTSDSAQSAPSEAPEG